MVGFSQTNNKISQQIIIGDITYKNDFSKFLYTYFEKL